MTSRCVPLLMIVLLTGAAHAQIDTRPNQISRLTSVGNQFTRTFHQYDALGRITATQYEQDGQVRIVSSEFGYPQNPQSTSGLGTVIVAQVLADGELVTYVHDAGGLQVEVRSTFGSVTEDVVRDVRQNARGQVTRLELGNGTVTTRSYDDAGNLALVSTRTVNGAGQEVQEYEYDYDGNLNITGIRDGVVADLSASYEYDSLDQLISIRNASGNVLESYAYDAIGNLIQKGALIQTYGAGGRPGALATSGGISYEYDGNGNVISIGAATMLEWNAENMSTRVTTPSTVTQKSFLGEAPWKKVEGGVTTYYLPSMRIENGIARKYYGHYAERFEQPGDRQLRFYHPDQLGSSSVMTDRTGNVIRRASYFPWGQDRGVEGSFTPKLQFNFKEKDAGGFYDYGARIYNPGTGRWLSPDTASEEQLHRYTYVRNNPLTMTDPTGHWPTWVHNLILEAAFPGLVGTVAMEQLKRGNYEVDMKWGALPQTLLEKNAHEHSMLSGAVLRDNHHDRVKATVKAREMTKDFVAGRLEVARKIGLAPQSGKDNQLFGTTREYWFALGEATHAPQDGTSPEHYDYQVYDLMPYKLRAALSPALAILSFAMDSLKHAEGEDRLPTDEEFIRAVAVTRAVVRERMGSEAFYTFAITRPPRPRYTEADVFRNLRCRGFECMKGRP